MSVHPAEEHERAARNRFDGWSESTTFRRLGPWLMYVQENLLGEIEWNRTERVLDIACGSGWLVFEAARRLPKRKGALACGCDLSEGMLHQGPAGGLSDDRVRFMAASAQRLPFKNRSFDAVMCTAAFHHFPEPDRALLEFKRVLRPGGIVLICDTCRDQSIGIWVWDRLHRWFEKGHVKYYRRDELRALLRDAGFKDIIVRELNPSFSETRKLVRKTSLFKVTVA